MRAQGRRAIPKRSRTSRYKALRSKLDLALRMEKKRGETGIRTQPRSRQFLTLLATNFDRFEGVSSPLESGDWRKLKMRVENKRHTNAHQPLTSLSQRRLQSPPSPPQQKSSVNMRLFAPCYYFSNDYYN